MSVRESVNAGSVIAVPAGPTTTVAARSAAALRRAAAGPRGGLALALLCLAVYLPGFFTIPVVDRDEARFAQASRQMLESGDRVVPRVQGVPRLNKPPLIYWLQSASANLLTGGDASRDAIWMYRIPSLLTAIVTVLATWRLGLAMFDPRAAWLGAAILAACPVMYWEARQARADMVLVACTSVAVLLLWNLWRRLDRPRVRTPWPTLLAFWAAVALGVLTKGPITPLVVGLALVVLGTVTGRWAWMRRLRPLLGLCVVAAAVGPWVYLVAQQVGFGTYWATIHAETLGRAASAREGHTGPPGFHLVFLLVLLFPGSLLVALALWRGLVRGTRSRPAPAGSGRLVRARHRLQTLAAGRPAELFLLCVVTPSWVLFEVSGTKLPHYTMPLYPAIALLCARTVLAGPAWLRRHLASRSAHLALGAWTVGVVLFIIAVTVGVVAALGAGAIAIAVSSLVAAGAIALFLRAVLAPLRERRMARVQILGLGVFIAGGIALGLAAPHISLIWTSRALARALDRLDPDAARPLGTVHYQEDSLVFETRGRIERVEEIPLCAWASIEHPGALVIIPAKKAVNRSTFRELARVRGFNYSKGKSVDLIVGEFRDER